MVYVREGTINAKGTWKLTTTGAITLGTTPLTFENEVMAHLADDTIHANVNHTTDVTIYVDPSSGDDSNGGLTSGDALQSINAAKNLAGTYKHGNIVINLAVGTYSGSNNKNITFSKIYGTLTINGPDVAVGVTPTAIIDFEGTGNITPFKFEFCNNVTINDVKFINASNTMWPLSAYNNTKLICNNVHINGGQDLVVSAFNSNIYLNDCRLEEFVRNGAYGEFNSGIFLYDTIVTNTSRQGVGVNVLKCGTGSIAGGTINNCNYGVNVVNSSYCFIGASMGGTDLTISNCMNGIYQSKHSFADFSNVGITFTGNTVDMVIDDGMTTIGNITYYVNTATGNDGNSGTAESAFKTISKAISMIPKNVNHLVTINVAAGTYAEDIEIKGFFGSGYIMLSGDSVLTDTYVLNSILVDRCSCDIYVTGFKATSTSKNAFTASNSQYVNFGKCKCDASTTSWVAFYIVASFAVIQNSLASNRSVGINATYMSNVFSNTNTGSNNTKGLSSQNAAKIGKSSTQPSGTTAEEITGGGQIV
jgi:hypothetical protein